MSAVFFAGLVSIMLSLLVFAMWKKYHHAWLLYAHLFFLLSPFLFASFRINCSMGFVGSLLSFCTLVFAKFMLYFVPPVLLATFITGVIVIPKLYERNAKKHENSAFTNLCRKTGIAAQLFVVDKALPVAFSLGKSVFVSVGMFELLSKKELEAVLLHELAHVKNNSAWSKFSTNFVRIFSPVAWFSGSHSVEAEEIKADSFAIKAQGTKKFLMNAKKKVSLFC
ncbi:M48 family metalloprotease [Candidatus Woesearchaeota archaeon]|nr:M48 family metalloprotease [Candidatus Woesearchaeota archaeon]